MCIWPSAGRGPNAQCPLRRQSKRQMPAKNKVRIMQADRLRADSARAARAAQERWQLPHADECPRSLQEATPSDDEEDEERQQLAKLGLPSAFGSTKVQAAPPPASPPDPTHRRRRWHFAAKACPGRHYSLPGCTLAEPAPCQG